MTAKMGDFEELTERSWVPQKWYQDNVVDVSLHIRVSTIEGKV